MRTAGTGFAVALRSVLSECLAGLSLSRSVVAAVAALVAVVFLANRAHHSLRSRLSRDTKRLPPGPPRWPIVGNLVQLGRFPHRDMAAFCEKYGPLVYLRLGSVDAITTTDPGIIREILVHQDDVFASRPRTMGAVHLAYGCGDVALAPLGPHWKRMRRVCVEHLLTAKRLKSFAGQRAEEASHLVKDVFAQCQRGSPINLREVLGSFSMNNVTRMLLGKRYFGARTAGPEEATEFMHVTHELFRLLGIIYLGDYLPVWRWIDPEECEKKMREVGKKIDDFHSSILQEHRKRKGRLKDGDEEVEEDFVDVLLSLPGEDGKDHMDDVEIKALIQDMIAGGTDTSAVTNEWAMAEVIKHPRVLSKVQEELDRVVGQLRMVGESDLPNLHYLRCVACETFRLHPPAPFIVPHESVQDTTVNGFHIPAGTRVFMNAYGLGRNAGVWDEAEEFRPERHLARREPGRAQQWGRLQGADVQCREEEVPRHSARGDHGSGGSGSALSLLRVVNPGWNAARGRRHDRSLWVDNAHGPATSGCCQATFSGPHVSIAYRSRTVTIVFDMDLDWFEPTSINLHLLP